MSDIQSYTIEELSEKSGLSVRTVRYYISEKILEGPEGRGKNAVYSGEHLLRLQAARELKGQGVSLGEIKRLVPALDEKELRQLVSRSEEQKVREEKAREISPRAYLSALLERPAQAAPFAEHSGIVMEQQPEAGYGAAVWRRYTLKEGLELHVTEDKRHRYSSLIKKIIELTGGDHER